MVRIKILLCVIKENSCLIYYFSPLFGIFISILLATFILQPQVEKEEYTPEKEPETDDDSTLMKQVKKDIERIENSDRKSVV